MRRISLLFVVVFLGCNREAVLPDPASTIIDVTYQPNWRTTDLDSTYRIQFPRGYQGGIGPTIEGPEFSLIKNDQRASFLGTSIFSGGGAPLPNPQPDSLINGNVRLNRVVSFQRNGQTQGLFYYTKQAKALGRLYVRQDGILTYRMNIRYDSDLHQEVLGILQTIQPR